MLSQNKTQNPLNLQSRKSLPRLLPVVEHFPQEHPITPHVRCRCETEIIYAFWSTPIHTDDN